MSKSTGRRNKKGESYKDIFTSTEPWAIDPRWSEKEKRKRQSKSRNKLRGKAKKKEQERLRAGENNWLIQKSCSSKRAYKTEKQALAASAQTERPMSTVRCKKVKVRSNISAYKCKFCGQWHLTHIRRATINDIFKDDDKLD